MMHDHAVLAKMDYSVLIISVASFHRHYSSVYPQLSSALGLRDDDYCPLYDWLVTEAVARAVLQCSCWKLLGHYRHDLYRCFFDQLGHGLQLLLVDQITRHLSWDTSTVYTLKVMVAGDNLFLARSTHPQSRKTM